MLLVGKEKRWRKRTNSISRLVRIVGISGGGRWCGLSPPGFRSHPAMIRMPRFHRREVGDEGSKTRFIGFRATGLEALLELSAIRSRADD